ncbi:GGDEF domain-containing protein [Candidatus Methylopumilus turicensis]|uniref:GGDEF domain-containing protein n=1 Tax=Candidatus Methylopumilus turicensis TaxID=1581680 RepID=UPI001185B84F|nr:GGDEF domain-containing protein [Candidatus Methylopumilus turicensis]
MLPNNNSLPLDELQLYSKEKLDLGLEVFLRDNLLQASFQPIFDFNTAKVLGFEGLAPIELIRAARVSSTVVEGEYLGRHLVLESFAKQGLEGKIFLNVSLDVLLQSEAKTGETLKYLAEFGLSPSDVVIKLSRSESGADVGLLTQACAHYRGMGFQLAICNLNQGFSGLSLWSEVKPEYVQLDKDFIDGIHHDKVKLEIARSIYEVASQSNAKVIADGVNNSLDLMAIRDLGVDLGQGSCLAEAAVTPVQILPEAVIKSLLRVEAPRENVLQTRATVSKLLRYVTPVSPSDTNEEVFRLFEQNPDLHAVPVVQATKPLGLISRGAMIDSYARPYRRELFGDKSCVTMMDDASIIVDHNTTVQDLTDLILRSDPRHLSAGFIVSNADAYLGMGNGHDLLRLISNLQINAARYANPLTLLPGNTPICEQIDLLIQSGTSFVTCYFDLDNFKPFNDVYGFQKGDEVIQLTARLISKACGMFDFVGHIGGDDFIVLFQSADWEQRCYDFLDEVSNAFPQVYDEEDRLRGGIEAEDRKGVKHFYPILTISIASVKVSPGMFPSHHEVSEACISAKKYSKKFTGNSMFIERRLPFIVSSKQQSEQVH